MSLIVLNNSPVKFIDGTYVGYNQLSLDCNCITRPFCQLVERDDPTAFETDLTFIDNVEMVTAPLFGTGCGVDWTCGANWSIAAAQGVKTAGAANDLEQPVPIMATRYYRLQFTIDSISGGTLTVTLGGNTVNTYTTTGTKTAFILLDTISDIRLIFSGDAGLAVAIEVISLIEFSSLNYQIVDCDDRLIAYQQTDSTNQSYSTDTVRTLIDWTIALDGCFKICLHDSQGEMVLNGDFFEDEFWTLDAGWSILNGVLTISSGATPTASQTFRYPLLSGCCYDLTFDVLNHVTGDVIVDLDGDTLGEVGADGSFNFHIDLTGQTDGLVLGFTGKGEAVSDEMDIDNVSIVMSGDDSGESPLQCCEGICSECFKVADEWDCTFLLSWTNDDSAFGFDYTNISFTQFLRVEGKFNQPSWSKDKQTHLSSNGSQDMLYSRVLETKLLRLREIPDYIHAALAIGLEHDSFFVDGVANINNEDNYEPNHRNSSLLSPIELEMEESLQDLVNSSC